MGSQFGNINSPTPMWAKWMFRVTILITSVLSFWIGGTTLIVESIKLEIVLALKALDILMFGLSKMFGIKEEELK